MVIPWALPVIIALVIVAFAVAWWLASRRKRTTATYVAHTDTARNLPRFRERITALQTATMVGLVGLLCITVASAVLVARPREVVIRDDELATRDIVLCLDVSGSVAAFDSEIMENFAELAKSFEGERVALVIWNSTSRVVFPLTDDYQMIQDQLLLGAESLAVADSEYGPVPRNSDDYYNFISGTMVNVGGGSLVGDGLASCAMQFDRADEERSRSIILATDNEVSGDEAQVFTLEAALEYTSEQDITVNGLYINPLNVGSSMYREDMEELIVGEGGYFFPADSPDAAAALVEDVEEQQAVDLGAEPVTVITDTPQWWPLVAAAGVVILIGAAWRYRL